MLKQGYDVFGKAYGVMNRNDLHATESIDHQLLQSHEPGQRLHCFRSQQIHPHSDRHGPSESVDHG